MKTICSVLMGLFLAASTAWAVIGGGDIIFEVEGMASVLYRHDDHVSKARLKCTECHYALYSNHAQRRVVGMTGMQKGKSCGFCHNGTRAFGVADKKHCVTCHNNKLPEK